jgi:FkbM family methyltransferase
MDRTLVFDVGLHEGQDTAYYLFKGYTVVAVDANPAQIAAARERSHAAVTDQRLKLVHCAVAADSGEIDFHVGLGEHADWSSLNPAIAGNNQRYSRIRVPARRLADLFDEYGTPYYCKMDVEGADLLCLQSLEGRHDLPLHVSVESECPGPRPLTDAEVLDTLNALRGIGYSRFKLVDQETLAVLPAYGAGQTRRYYRRVHAPTLRDRIQRRLGLSRNGLTAARDRVSTRLHWSFPMGSSGPFGDDLAGDWMEYQEAADSLLRYRRDYLSLPTAQPHGFWCDWHATT